MRVRARALTGALLSALGAMPTACGGRQTGAAVDDGVAGDSGVTCAAGAAACAGASMTVAGAPGVGGTSTAGTPGTGGSGTAGTPTSSMFACDQPTAVAAAPGYERCGEEGPLYRASAEACPSALPRPSIPNASEFDLCHSDADCAERPHGFCSHQCTYGCVVDADCAVGEICLCSSLPTLEPVGKCIQVSCTSDADCAPGFRCQSYEGLTNVMGQGAPANVTCGIVRFACQSPADSCASARDCQMNQLCNADNGRFECRATAGDCASIGRPFLVAGAPRVAELRQRDDWSNARLGLATEQLAPELRAAAAAAWLRMGLLEHASVAAFARFGLQLLSFGAPPELVDSTAHAMADETAHAKLAFGIAAELGGNALGPGRLDLAQAFLPTTLSEVTRLVFREGCVGETVAALAAGEAAAHATEPALRQVLVRIADDETRHAELAWRFVKWALAQQPSLLPLVEAELQRAQAELATPPAANPPVKPEDLLGLGILTEALGREVRAMALSQVIAPCAAALIGQRLRSDRLHSQNRLQIQLR